MLKTKRQIVAETIAWIEKHGRCVSEKSGNCLYIGDDGNMCAVGRCLIDPARARGDVSSMVRRVGRFDDLLKPEYRGHCVSFWAALQEFHDFYGVLIPNHSPTNPLLMEDNLPEGYWESMVESLDVWSFDEQVDGWLVMEGEGGS